MIKCKNCGYENNDGSQICLNCRESLDQSKQETSNAEKYIRTNQEAVSKIERTNRKAAKKIVITYVAVLAVVILGIVIYFINLYKPVVDASLFGSWKVEGYGYTEVWTFEKDGTYSIDRSGTGIFADSTDTDDWYYKAENGRIKVSWSKNIEKYTSATYEYQFAFTSEGKRCLILNSIGDGIKTALVKVS